MTPQNVMEAYWTDPRRVPVWSISETREAGFSPSRVKKCLYGQRDKHHGHTFERAAE